jgi:hypothetical protein
MHPMNATRDLENARTPDDVVAAMAASMAFWTDEELARYVPGQPRPRIACAEDIEDWADRLQRHVREVPLLEPDESGRERLARLFLLASVKLRLLQRVSLRARMRRRFDAIAGGALAD